MKKGPEQEIQVIDCQTADGIIPLYLSRENAADLMGKLLKAFPAKTGAPLGDTVREVIDYLNLKTSSRFRTDTGGMIAARLKEGFTLADCKKVINIKTEHWQHDPMMFKFLRPSTLFRPVHFQEYLNEKLTPYDK